MSPTPLVSRRINSTAGTGKFVYHMLSPDIDQWGNVADYPIDPTTMSVNQVLLITMENTRLQTLCRMLYAVRSLAAQRQALNAFQNEIKLPNKVSTPPILNPPPKAPIEECPEFPQIEKYLFRNRQELVLDSMTFPIPEYTLYHYILTNSKEKIGTLTPETWRAFLVTCHSKSYIFT